MRWLYLLHESWVCSIITIISPYVRYQIVKMFITLESHGIFLSHLHSCVSTFPNFWHVIPPIFDRYGFAEQLSSLACGGELVKILISFDPYRLFRSNFAYLFIFMLSIHPSMPNGGEGLRSIILAGQGHLVKMLIKVRKGAKIRNRYNQVPHLIQDTNGKVTNSQFDTTNESKEVSPFPAATRHI